jgi:hypothetical protein
MMHGVNETDSALETRAGLRRETRVHAGRSRGSHSVLSVDAGGVGAKGVPEGLPFQCAVERPALATRRFIKEISRLREEAEALMDYLDLLEARARNEGEPRYWTAELRKRLGLD